MPILGCMWPFKTKIKPNGSVNWYEARLVAQGFKQTQGIDIHETFIPVIKMPTTWILLIVAPQNNWLVLHLDVSNAFLYDKLMETSHMKQSPSFQDTQNPHHVWLLNKAIYGLKRALRQWFLTFSTHLYSQGFQINTPDPSIFTKISDHSQLYLDMPMTFLSRAITIQPSPKLSITCPITSI